ncbi:MAG: deoxyribonuclease IV [candidate division WOR-3 bacterium]
MKLGFHISIMGGFKNVVARAKKRNCETIQIFSRNPRGWKYKSIDEEDCQVFKEQIRENNISPIFVHLPYLINLGSDNNELFKKSIASLTEDLKRAKKLGARYLITHCGSNKNAKTGIRRMAQAIIQAFIEVDNDVTLLIENTAGSGNEFGYDFEQLRGILDAVNSNRIGIVFDTAHAFAAGYELKTKKGVDETIKKMERIVGIERVHLIHFNDSMTKIGSRKDRHWHIGKGEIGAGMKFIINHSALRHLPFIMETPRTNTKEDLLNLKVVREMIKRP